jgi:hypothetical protein
VGAVGRKLKRFAHRIAAAEVEPTKIVRLAVLHALLKSG